MTAGERSAFAIIIGSAIVALWTDVRFPRLGPVSLPTVVLHLLASAMLLPLAASFLALGSPEQPLRVLAILFGIVFPALVYIFIAGLWLLKLFGAMIPGGPTAPGRS